LLFLFHLHRLEPCHEKCYKSFAIQASSIVLYEVYTKLLFKRRHVNNVTSLSWTRQKFAPSHAFVKRITENLHFFQDDLNTNCWRLDIGNSTETKRM